MPKIDFQKKYENFKKYRDKRDRYSLRYRKFIAKAVKEIIIANSLKLNNDSIVKISLEVYGKKDKISVNRTKLLLRDDIVRDDIRKELQHVLVKNEIKPVDKVVKLISEAEKKAKSTSDFIQLNKFYLDLVDIEPKSNPLYEQVADFSRYRKT